MTKKADFDAEEWQTVVEAPLLAGLRVVAADRGGTIRESVAIGRVYADARQRHGESELLDDLVASPPGMDQERVRAAGDVRAASQASIRSALGILESKATTDEVETYKRFLVAVARAAAEAHKEGGFAGIGGKQVSEAEETALDEIAATLDAGPGA